MAVLIRLEINVPGWTVADLQRAVHDLDVMDSEPEPAITVEAVRASDVLQFGFAGAIGLDLHIMVDEMEDYED